ncbi:MAG: hypothetical protein WBP56_04450 [Polyangia bacterium]
MKLVATRQIEQGALNQRKVDLFIGASGFEERATHLLGRVGPNFAAQKVAFAFDDRKTEQRERNDKIFADFGCALLETKGDDAGQIVDYLRAVVAAHRGDVLSIAVDYSCMTRAWCGAVVHGLRAITEMPRIGCLFCYSPASFEEPVLARPNASVGPLAGFCGLDTPDRPTALVIGLGYERERALGLREFVDPAATFAFLTDPAIDGRYRDAVLRNNATLLSSLPKAHVFRYPMRDLQRTADLLVSLCDGLREKYRVILAPLGPKPFSLLCMLLATRVDLDVWRVTQGTKAQPQNRAASGDILVLNAEFEAC